MRKPEINFRKITKYYSFRLFQSMFRLLNLKRTKSGSPATAVIYYVSTSLISCLGFDSCFRAHHCSVITTHPCSSYYLHLCTESPSMAQTHCCPVSQFLFFSPLFSCHLSCAISVITQFYPISFFCILAFLLLWTLLILESSNTFPQLHQFHSHFPCFLKCHILPFPSLLTLLSLSLLFSVWQWHWKVHPCNFKDGTAWELSVNAAWGTGLVHALQHKGTLVHDEHCKWCKAGLVFMKSKPFKVVGFF